MEGDQKLVSRLQNKTACDVVIQRYDYLVRHVNATRILPHLVASKLVEPDFSEYLDHERTEKARMVAVLRELLRSPMEGWFKDFIGALSKFPQYQIVVDTLLTDFTKLMEERQAHPPPDDGEGGMLPTAKAATSASMPTPNIDGTMSGVNEVLRKALEEAQDGYKATVREAQAVMKEAKDDHKTALSELKKANDRVLEAEKSKCCAEAEKKVLEEKVQEIGKKLSATDDKLREVYDKLREAEVHKRLLEKEAQSYRDDVKESQQKMEEENMRLSTDLAELRLQEEAAREKVQETERERAALELRVANLQAEVESSRKEREEDVASHERQLSDARRQQQTVEEELKVVWKEMGKKQERLEDATRQLDELQSSREEELSHLRNQLERTTSRTGALEGELAEARRTKEKMDEVVLGLKEELEKNLAEQAKASERQEQKVNGLTKELEAAISDRDSLMAKYQTAGTEVERVKAELTELQERYRGKEEELEQFQKEHANCDVTKRELRRPLPSRPRLLEGGLGPRPRPFGGGPPREYLGGLGLGPGLGLPPPLVWKGRPPGRLELELLDPELLDPREGLRGVLQESRERQEGQEPKEKK